MEIDWIFRVTHFPNKKHFYHLQVGLTVVRFCSYFFLKFQNESFFQMFSLFLTILLLSMKSASSCRLLVPSEYLSGCIFDRLNVMAPRSGLTVNGQCCNRAVPKTEFIEQPYVYFQNAYEVIAELCSDVLFYVFWQIFLIFFDTEF